MNWLVIDSLYLNHSGNYYIIIMSPETKLLAEMASIQPILKGDILTPVSNLRYLVSNRSSFFLTYISSVKYSSVLWALLKRIQDNLDFSNVKYLAKINE